MIQTLSEWFITCRAFSSNSNQNLKAFTSQAPVTLSTASRALRSEITW